MSQEKPLKFKKPLSYKIEENQSIKAILKHFSFDTLGSFDLDNTLIRPARAKDIGSDQWFSMLISYAYKTIPDRKEAKKLVLELNRYIQDFIKVKPVEDLAPDILKRLKDVGLPIMGLTARGIENAETTEKQLKAVGIQFFKLTDNFTLDIGDPTRQVCYRNGVLYCNGANKGTCLNAFMKYLKKKYSVVMTDDTGKNLTQMLEAAQQGEYSFTGIRYSAMDERISRFNKPEAMKKLRSWIDSKFLPDAAVNIIEKLKLTSSEVDLTKSASEQTTDITRVMKEKAQEIKKSDENEDNTPLP